MAKTVNTYKKWTKSELKRFIKIWDTSNVDDLAEEFGVKKNTVQGMASRFRKLGYPLQRKRVVGETSKLMMEVIAEAKAGR